MATGCALTASPVYEADFNVGKKPPLSLPEAYENLKSAVQKIYYSNGTTAGDLRLTGEGFTFKNNGAEYALFKYSDIQNLTVYADPNSSYFYVEWNANFYYWWKVQSDAQTFVDAVMAMKYYASKQFLADDAVAFEEFQDKANIWRTASVKPPLPEEARRFRVVADDAVQNNNFDKAAGYYEQGLAIDPMWPAGQYNVAVIYKELNFYTMAVMHMKRYLALKPEDTQKYRDQMYIWEEKVNEQQ